MKMLLLYIERGLVIILAVVALLLAVVSFRGLVNLQDPVSPVGYIDKLSLLFGLHEQTHVIVVNTNKWSTDVHLFTFQKRLKDGAFFLTKETSGSTSSGLLDNISQQNVERKCADVVSVSDGLVPFTANKNSIPILLGLPALGELGKDKQKTLVSTLHGCLSNSEYEYTKEGSIGTISSQKQVVMQWFALSLLNGHLPYKKPIETPVVAETDDDDLKLTFAVSSFDRLPNSTVAMYQKVSVFGGLFDLVTVKIPDLGLFRARQLVLTGSDVSKEVITSPCVNPVVDRWWDFRGKNYHVKGVKRYVEEVKERNGPFAGKRVSRPVANFDDCHAHVVNFINKKIDKEFDFVIQDLKKRKVYMRGNIFVKCSERGLTDPFKGGDVKLKAFMDSLKHACKVPNTEQPYACVDMMIIGVILDKILGLHKSSILHTVNKVAGMTGDWQVAAALQLYQNGL